MTPSASAKRAAATKYNSGSLQKSDSMHRLANSLQ
jgi:hypothetical protein